MSSPHSDSPEERPRDQPLEKRPGPLEEWWSRVESWRRVMLAGAVLLLASAILRARFTEGFPGTALLVATFVGYLLLAVGFLQFFGDRRKK